MVFNELNDIYREVILDHCRNPRNHHKLENATITGYGVNPFCGDEVLLQVILDNSGRVIQIGTQSQGCSINQAASSIMTQVVDRKTVAEIKVILSMFREFMTGSPCEAGPLTELGELEALSGVRRLPVRIKCAMLSWSALEEGIEDYHLDLERRA